MGFIWVDLKIRNLKSGDKILLGFQNSIYSFSAGKRLANFLCPLVRFEIIEIPKASN
ncbi:hypothetical protein ADICYQ_2421 [Cyclobacterium qasimii M12-11B]|uniref:Uncharacterized protein n=1 Tax=Cyclobacterium qasimii M12-11B TaxID=641524 RepID=S7WX88_9BACT|nr:hypothetical protein ADICYQ_2421 [Cyclobacterium qasimii M12-11B]